MKLPILIFSKLSNLFDRKNNVIYFFITQKNFILRSALLSLKSSRYGVFRTLHSARAQLKVGHRKNAFDINLHRKL